MSNIENKLVNTFLLWIIALLLILQELFAKFILDRNIQINNNIIEVKSNTMKKLLVILFDRVDDNSYYYFDNNIIKRFNKGENE